MPSQDRRYRAILPRSAPPTTRTAATRRKVLSIFSVTPPAAGNRQPSSRRARDQPRSTSATRWPSRARRSSSGRPATRPPRMNTWAPSTSSATPPANGSRPPCCSNLMGPHTTSLAPQLAYPGTRSSPAAPTPPRMTVATSCTATRQVNGRRSPSSPLAASGSRRLPSRVQPLPLRLHRRPRTKAPSTSSPTKAGLGRSPPRSA